MLGTDRKDKKIEDFKRAKAVNMQTEKPLHVSHAIAVGPVVRLSSTHIPVHAKCVILQNAFHS